MESIIYEKDYSITEQKEPKSPDIFTQLLENGFFDMYGTLIDQLPKKVIEKDKETYERVLHTCDDYAKQWHGKVYGIVDYDKWESHIHLTLPFLEIVSEEDRAFWKDIVDNASTICVENTEDGNVKLKINIDYFEEVLDPETTEEEVRTILLNTLRASGKEIVPDDEVWETLIADFRAKMIK